MHRSEIGSESGVRIVTVKLGDPLPNDHCMVCGTTNVHVCHDRRPHVNLVPTRGKPYPTFDAHWTQGWMLTCRECGARYGGGDGPDEPEPCPLEHLPYDIHTRVRIDQERIDDELRRWM